MKQYRGFISRHKCGKSVNGEQVHVGNCESVDLSEKRCGDLNTITSLIKSFLRQLPIPLITYEAYPDLIDIARELDCINNATVI
ncbi:hypothetical protein ACTXT7_012927 [Hymenolepis weldensis]